jgi:hypothetical protein
MLALGIVAVANTYIGPLEWGSGTVYYSGVPFAISWSDGYAGYYDVGWYGVSNNDYNIWGERQGGCDVNAANRPFASAVSGYVQYHWNGGTGSPIYDISGATLCNSGDNPWGNGDTSTSVLWFGNESSSTDYVDVESTWTCGADCFPGTLTEGSLQSWR